MLKIAYGLVILLAVAIVVRNALVSSATVPTHFLYLEGGVLLLVGALLLSIHHKLKALDDRIDSAVKSADTLQKYLTDSKLTYLLGRMYERIEDPETDTMAEDFEVHSSNSTSTESDVDKEGVPGGAREFAQDFRERLRRSRRVGPR